MSYGIDQGGMQRGGAFLARAFGAQPRPPAI
jgi:hypothetical protein